MDASLIKTPIQAVADWMKTADLAEVVYRKNGTGFSLTAFGSSDRSFGPDHETASLPLRRFLPIVSDGVGIFQWNEPGKARKADDGVQIAVGDIIGVLVTGAGASKPIVAAHAGRVAKIFINPGQAVEYGQPLLLLEA